MRQKVQLRVFSQKKTASSETPPTVLPAGSDLSLSFQQLPLWQKMDSAKRSKKRKFRSPCDTGEAYHKGCILCDFVFHVLASVCFVGKLCRLAHHLVTEVGFQWAGRLRTDGSQESAVNFSSLTGVTGMP